MVKVLATYLGNNGIGGKNGSMLGALAVDSDRLRYLENKEHCFQAFFVYSVLV